MGFLLLFFVGSWWLGRYHEKDQFFASLLEVNPGLYDLILSNICIDLLGCFEHVHRNRPKHLHMQIGSFTASSG